MTGRWDLDPFLLGGLLALALVFRLVVGPGRRRLAPDAVFPVKHVLIFDAALLVFYLAVASPLDEAGERFLFSAHMVQHSILIFLLPILVLWALPDWLVVACLDRPVIRSLADILGHPVAALFGFTAIFYAWHIPGFYEWALRDRGVHEAEHLMYVVAGAWMWWPVFGKTGGRGQRGPLGPGGRILYVFAMSISQIPLFAALAFAGHVLYPTYEAAPRLVPMLSPLEDQVLGGILMKVIGELVSLAIIVSALMRWYAQENPEAGESCESKSSTSLERAAVPVI